jgi:N-acetylneuraminate lyase
MFDGEQPVNDTSLSGIYPAIVTPLTGDGELATGVAERLMARLMAAGVDGVYAAGSTGEGMRMSLAGRETLVECLMSNLPQGKKLLVHVGAPRVEDAIRLAVHAAKAGAHAISSLPTQGAFPQVRDYYKRLAEHSPLPLILYYFPEVCPNAFQNPEELREICALPNVSGVKFTDFNLFLLEQLAASGKVVYNGRDEVLAAGLLMGAQGGIGSTYNLVPEIYVALYRHTLRGEWLKARQLQRSLNQLIAVLVKYPFLPALKAALESAGFACGATLNGEQFESPAQQQQFLSELALVMPQQGAVAI